MPDGRRTGGDASSPYSRASADAETLLDGAILLAVLPGGPDERPKDDREREDADGGNQYREEDAHGDRSRVMKGRP